MAILEKLIGTLKLREAWRKIDRNEKAINDEIVNHKASSEAHDADAIVYKGKVVGAHNTKQAIDNVQEQVNTLVLNGDSSVAAKQAAIDAKGHDYQNLKLRLDTEHEQVTAQLAETDQQISFLGTKRKIATPINKGIITFNTDDGRKEDYTVFKDIFAAAGVPCCTAVVPTWITSGSALMATIPELKELQDVHGWEILSHSYDHTDLTTLNETQLTENLRNSRDWLNSQGLRVSNLAYPFGKVNDLVRRVASRYFRSARQSIFGTKGYNEMPIDTYGIRTLWMDKDVALGSYDGFPINTFEYYKNLIDKANAAKAWLVISYHSGTTVDQNIVGLIQQVVQYAAANSEVLTFSQALDKIGNVLDVGSSESETSRFSVSYNGISSLPVQNYGSDAFDGSSHIDRFKSDVLTINNVSGARAAASGLPTGQSGTLYTYNYGNGATTYLYTYQLYKTVLGNEYKRILRTNRTWGNFEKYNALRILDIDSTGPNNHISEYPFGISKQRFTKANAATYGLPESANFGGVLTNVILATDEMGFSYQEYYVYGTGRTYRRKFASNGYPTSQPWVMHDVVKSNPKNSITPTTSFASLPLGMTITRIDAVTAAANGAPENAAGTMITHKYDEAERGYNWQEYHIYGTSKIYKRSFNENSTPKAWEKVSVV